MAHESLPRSSRTQRMEPFDAPLAPPSSDKTVVLTVWAAVLWLLSPLAWNAFTSAPYPLPGARGLQEPTVGLPILIAVACWALALSFRRLHIPALIHGAGGFLLALGFMLSYFSTFEHTAGYALTMFGIILLRVRADRAGAA